MCCYCSIFCGFERRINWKSDLAAMIKYWDKGMGHPDHPHAPLMLSSRFKWETRQKLFCQTLAHVTDRGCNISLWLSQYMQSLWARVNKEEPLFSNDDGKPMSISKLDVYFYALLK